MKFRKYLNIGKPAVKGSILVIFGILNSRIGIGVEIFTNNLIYGPLAYLFLAFSGIIITRFLLISKNLSNDSRLKLKSALITSGVFYIIGFTLIICNVIFNLGIYYLNFLILIFTALIGIFWGLSGYFGFKVKKNIMVMNIIVITFIFSMGIIYGALLNTFLFPIYIYFFFLSTTFLQLSRDLIKIFDSRENKENLQERFNQDAVLRVTLIFEILATGFFILPVYYITSYPLAYLVFMICGVTLIVFSCIFTLESILEKKISYRISSILKIGIVFQLIAFLISGG
ncbi:MAG: hypothetical protein ACFE9C_11015 [Candidatus Hodarchaeota archaeon]